MVSKKIVTVNSNVESEADNEIIFEELRKVRAKAKAKLAAKASAEKRNKGRKNDGPLEDTRDPHKWARLFIESKAHDGEKTLHFHGDLWHQWIDGRYVSIAEREMRARLVAFVKNTIDRERITTFQGDVEYLLSINTAWINNIYLALSSMCILPDGNDPPFLMDPERGLMRPNLVAFTNGLLDVHALLAGQGAAIRPPSPQWFSPVVLPYDFNPEANCLKWTRFLERNLEGDKDRIALLQEFAGYILSRDTGFQRFLVLNGEGSNGKSVVCAVLSALVGLENVSAIPLECFGQRFALTQTLGKLANIVSECGEIDRAAEGLLKAFTSGDRMFFDRKGISGVEAAPTARFILATNNLPRFSDRSGGLWRRMLLVPFNVEIKAGERVNGMDKASYWQNELSGIFNWAVAGLRRLREKGDFTTSAVCDVALAEFRRDTNPARDFLETFYDRSGDDHDPEQETETEEVYLQYKHWCEGRGGKALTNGHFGREVKRVFKMDRVKSLGRTDGKRFNVYKIVRRKDN